MSMRSVSGVSWVWRAFRRPGTLGALAILACGLFAASHADAQATVYNSLTLNWVAPGDDGTTGQVSSYYLRYSTSAPADTDSITVAGWWNGVPLSQRITLGPPLAAAGATDQTVVTGLAQGTTYYFALRAVDDAFNVSAFSNVATGTTQTCNPPTTAPPGFAAVADTGQVTTSWGTATDPQAVSVHLYRAQGTSGAWSLRQTLPLGTLSYLDTSVSAGTQYRYRAAYMGALCEGPFTSTMTVTTPGTPPAPAPPAAPTDSKIHAYPNPANGSLRLVVDVQATTAMPVYIRLFDLNGHWVATLVDGTYPPGTVEVPWGRVGRDGRTVGPGYYEILGTVGITRVRERLVLLP
jgi:hypothetical protein